MNHQTVNLLTKPTDHDDDHVDHSMAHRQEDPELQKAMVEHAISSLNNFSHSSASRKN
jgi:hypothetical protein